MDARLFRLPTKPNFFAAAGTANPFDIEDRQKFSTIPTQDSRFPGWAAPMADGRLVTDYKNHCSQNIPAGSQFATKKWLTENGTELTGIIRERLAKQTGSIYGLDNSVVPPPVARVNCTRSECTRTATNAPGGIGVERAPADLPELFGTWDARITTVSPKPNVAGTSRYEGGRNTPRGNEMH
jgi:hypothetical protein